MPEDLPESEDITKSSLGDLVSIGEAAQLLDISVDTLRRWDKDGKIYSVRPDGKNRYFPLSEIERIKYSSRISIGEASNTLGISIPTLRRLEEKGILKPSRDNNGERIYEKEDIQKFLHSDYFLQKKYVEEKILEPFSQEKEEVKDDETHVKIKVLGAEVDDFQSKISLLYHFRKKLILSIALFVMISFIIVSILTAFFIVYPSQTARFLGYRDENDQVLIADYQDNKRGVLGAKTEREGAVYELLRSILRPFGMFSLVAVEKISPDAYAEIAPYDINDIFSLGSNGKIKPKTILSLIPEQFEITGKELIKNLNADYLRGRIPGESEGDLATYSEGGSLIALQLVENNFPDGVIDLSKSLVSGLLPLQRGGTNKDLSTGSLGGLVYKGGDSLLVSD
ncbi:MAG: MerR family DNA-binding transcriptional regulator, partial [Candidatus Levybacteria bacterium]|nr:MerR family DNA-binding transcriptional regulator [Candidatus Levybacteria bacterium]